MPLTDRLPRRLCALLAAAILALAAGAALGLRPATARASDQQLSVMMDDDSLVYGSDHTRDLTMAAMKSLGVDYIRVTVLWSVVAQGARDPIKVRGKHGRIILKKRPFNAADPHSYPYTNWDRYDRLVRAAQAFGLGVYLDVTGPGPSWAMGRTKDRHIAATFMPKPREFYKFVLAVGKRYSGSFIDEDDDRSTPLPRVSFWSLWNEPNQGGWLTPQWQYDSVLHRKIPFSPILYRELYGYGHLALVLTGHGSDTIYAGETAPLGSSATGPRDPMRPRLFVNELFCRRPDGTPYVGVEATQRRCGEFAKFAGFPMSGWAHHPYTKALAPQQADPNPDSITLANIDSLPAQLDGIAAATGYFKPGLPILLSEFGYETNPPDPFVGIPLDRQAAYINLGDEIAYHDPRISGQTQFLLRDVPPVRRRNGRKVRRGSKKYWFTYQSGLFFANGVPKPAAAAYQLPFDVFPVGAAPDGTVQMDVWGQLRFRPNTDPASPGTDEVYIQFRPLGSPQWTTVGGLPRTVTSSRGFFEYTVPAQGPGAWRAVWLGKDKPFTAISRTVLTSQ